MQKDFRPYWLKRFYLRIESWYVYAYLEPRLVSLGDNAYVMRPWTVHIDGPNIHIGRQATLISDRDQRIRLGVWGKDNESGEIHIGDYVIISPAVRISAAESIRIGDNCMLANGVYITDSDWHGVYDRVSYDEAAKPVVLEDNVWLGDRVTVLKGVKIGRNSIVAAGAVVTKDIPENVIAAGNPACVVKNLDESKGFVTRKDFFSNAQQAAEQYDQLQRFTLAGNGFFTWLLRWVWPRWGKK
ncbi:acyltransferase [bacterium]|nr:acyltransferase [bacterium]